MPTLYTDHNAQLDAPDTQPDVLDLEELKDSFRQTILDRYEVVPNTRKLHLIDVVVNTPEVLIQEMNEIGFKQDEWFSDPSRPYPQVSNGTYGIQGTHPTVCARLDFLADGVDLDKAYCVGVMVCHKLRLGYTVMNNLFPHVPQLGRVAQQFHYARTGIADDRIIGASVIAQIRDTNRRGQTYGHLYDDVFPQGYEENGVRSNIRERFYATTAMGDSYEIF